MIARQLSNLIQQFSDAAGDHPYLTSSLMIATVTALGFLVADWLRAANLDELYLLIVFVSALKWGRRPAVFTALASALVFTFCFIPPRFTFAITDLAYSVTFFVFIIVAVTTSEVASRARDLIREQAARTQAA